MRVRDVMTKNVEFINVNNTAQQAAMMMKVGDYGALPVSDDDRLVGMITDRDLAIKVVADGSNSSEVKVGDLMSKGIGYCFDDESLEDVCENMAESQHRRLPVLNREKRLVGIISIVDMARSEDSLTITHEAMRQVCH